MADKEDDDPSLAFEIGRDSAGAGAAAALGALIGGPVGAVGGLVVGATFPHIINRVRVHLDARRDRVLQPSAAALGDEGVAERLDAHPDLVPLVVRACEMAARTEWEAHVDALGAVLRDGIVGDLEQDETSRLLTAIGTITPDGVAILNYLATHEPEVDSHYQDVTMAATFGWARGRARSALRYLEDAGAVDTVGGLLDGGEGWKPMPMSTRVLAYLREAGVATDAGRDP